MRVEGHVGGYQRSLLQKSTKRHQQKETRLLEEDQGDHSRRSGKESDQEIILKANCIRKLQICM